MNFNITNLSTKLQKSVPLVADQLGLSISDDGIGLQVIIQGAGIDISKKDNTARITIAKEQYFLRALSL